MPSHRAVFLLAMEAVLFLAVLTHLGGQVSAQFPISSPCNNCIVTQLSSQPYCAGVDITNATAQGTPEYRNCVCSATNNYTWTDACLNKPCTPIEVTSFQNSFEGLLKTGLNITCIRPTPSPPPTTASTTNAVTATVTAPTKPTTAAAAVQLTSQTAVVGWALIISTVVAVVSVL
ncbi:hypothetical protein FBU30_004827 [Linnemannia zychae]|nr:hypothetical protein FBU30_004827 [Linnemannia zychae]